MSSRILLIVVVFVAASCGSGREDSTASNLSPQDFQVVLVDVRSPDELQSQYLPGAHNIDFRSAAFSNVISTLDKEQTYLVYCASGIRSGKAAEMMREMGFDQVYTLDGGLKAWNDAKLPAEFPSALPSGYELQIRGQSIVVMKGDQSVAELTCMQAVGEACLAYSVALSTQLMSDPNGDRGLFYSSQEALDWVFRKLPAN